MNPEPVKIRYHQGEKGWALTREDGTYAIDNLPFDGGLVQFRDIVECQEPTDPTQPPFVCRIVQRTLHAWSVVRYHPPTQEAYTALRKAAEAAGLHTECSTPGTLVVASNVEDPFELAPILLRAISYLPLPAGLPLDAPGRSTVTFQVVKHRALPSAPLDLVDLDPDYGAPSPGVGAR